MTDIKTPEETPEVAIKPVPVKAKPKSAPKKASKPAPKPIARVSSAQEVKVKPEMPKPSIPKSVPQMQNASVVMEAPKNTQEAWQPIQTKGETAEEIWNKIKGRELGMFGLPDQFVENYCTPLPIDPMRCMLKYKVSSVIPALETVAKDYKVEMVGGYIAVSTLDEKY